MPDREASEPTIPLAEIDYGRACIEDLDIDAIVLEHRQVGESPEDHEFILRRVIQNALLRCAQEGVEMDSQDARRLTKRLVSAGHIAPNSAVGSIAEAYYGAASLAEHPGSFILEEEEQKIATALASESRDLNRIQEESLARAHAAIHNMQVALWHPEENPIKPVLIGTLGLVLKEKHSFMLQRDLEKMRNPTTFLELLLGRLDRAIAVTPSNMELCSEALLSQWGPLIWHYRERLLQWAQAPQDLLHNCATAKDVLKCLMERHKEEQREDPLNPMLASKKVLEDIGFDEIEKEVAASGWPQGDFANGQIVASAMLKMRLLCEERYSLFRPHHALLVLQALCQRGVLSIAESELPNRAESWFFATRIAADPKRAHLFEEPHDMVVDGIVGGEEDFVIMSRITDWSNGIVTRAQREGLSPHIRSELSTLAAMTIIQVVQRLVAYRNPQQFLDFMQNSIRDGLIKNPDGELSVLQQMLVKKLGPLLLLHADAMAQLLGSTPDGVFQMLVKASFPGKLEPSSDFYGK